MDLFYVIIGIVCFDFLLDRLLAGLNAKAWCQSLPSEISDIYSSEKFENHKQYRQTNYRFDWWHDSFGFILILFILIYRGFAIADSIVISFSEKPIVQGLLFFGLIGFLSLVIQIPFNWYHTFVVEEKYGFNKTSQKTFFVDILKSVLLGVLIGAPILSAVIWFYLLLGSSFWWVAWLLMGGFTLLMTMFYTSFILPLFNKQSPLESGDLRDAIEDFSIKANFKLDNIFVMDGSKRSSKANAFFSGLGSRKRIVLYDTLINDLSTDEIVAVLAHEIGHYKLKHTLWGTVFGIIQTGVLLFIFSQVVDNHYLHEALGVAKPSFHIGMVAFGLLFSPVSMIIGLVGNWHSRKNEYAADRFAANFRLSDPLISALKKLSSNSLSNPTPHWLYVIFNYSHPPLLQRMAALKSEK